jgi:hypothetical protein
MPKDKMTPEITPEKLVEKARRCAGGNRSACWAKNMDGDLKKFVEYLMELEEKHIKYSRSQASKDAQEYYGVTVQRNAFVNHIKGNCSCERLEK